MLGKLSRWLRLFGFDAEYRRTYSDEELIDLALKEKRILLSRDLDLYRRAKRKGVETLLIKGRSEAEELAEIAVHFGVELKVEPAESRCPKCDAPLKEVEKEEVQGKVPSKTYEVYDEFWICEKCGQVYWRGAHWKNIERIISKANSIRQNREGSSSSR
jgi:hypothetical protein